MRKRTTPDLREASRNCHPCYLTPQIFFLAGMLILSSIFDPPPPDEREYLENQPRKNKNYSHEFQNVLNPIHVRFIRSGCKLCGTQQNKSSPCEYSSIRIHSGSGVFQCHDTLGVKDEASGTSSFKPAYSVCEALSNNSTIDQDTRTRLFRVQTACYFMTYFHVCWHPSRWPHDTPKSVALTRD